MLARRVIPRPANYLRRRGQDGRPRTIPVFRVIWFLIPGLIPHPFTDKELLAIEKAHAGRERRRLLDVSIKEVFRHAG